MMRPIPEEELVPAAIYQSNIEVLAEQPQQVGEFNGRCCTCNCTDTIKYSIICGVANTALGIITLGLGASFKDQTAPINSINNFSFIILTVAGVLCVAAGIFSFGMGAYEHKKNKEAQVSAAVEMA